MTCYTLWDIARRKSTFENIFGHALFEPSEWFDADPDDDFEDELANDLELDWVDDFDLEDLKRDFGHHPDEAERLLLTQPNGLVFPPLSTFGSCLLRFLQGVYWSSKSSIFTEYSPTPFSTDETNSSWKF